MLGIKLIFQRKRSPITAKVYGGTLILITTLTILHLPYAVHEAIALGYQGVGGGLIGATFSFILQKAFGKTGTYIVLIAVSLVALLLLTNKPLVTLLGDFISGTNNKVSRVKQWLINFLYTDEDEQPPGSQSKAQVDQEGTAPPSTHTVVINGLDEVQDSKENDHLNKEWITGPIPKVTPQAKELLEQPWNTNKEPVAYTELSIKDAPNYQLPPLTLLASPGKRQSNIDTKDIKEQMGTLERTLANFGIGAKVTQVSRGPTITRFEIQPPKGIKVSKIVSLADDIALSMAAPDVRIEAPIPGKAAIGIEVPNKEISMVHIRGIIESREYVQSTSRLTIALGKDIAGNAVVADLSKMPHILIAGATGAGKSVCINTLIASILFKSTPEEVKLLMIDPKMVELATYNGIPHLVSPVVTNPKKAAASLRWAVKEMEKRYNLFAEAGVRDITRYNNLLKSKPNAEEKRLPLVVVIIDELADLMMVAPADVEDAVCRLAQMARAAGIHLVVATQRPSVDVITGLIKANIPSRISFAVSSQVDSRTILDMAGAEKLLGKGDMLFYPVGASKPVRVQGAFLSDKEVESLVNFLKQQGRPVYDEKVTKDIPQPPEVQPVEDELLPQAVKLLIEQGQASISMLQRRLHIGYARAARLIDMMEQRNIVGPYEGNKPRAILMTLEEYEQTFGQETSS